MQGERRLSPFFVSMDQERRIFIIDDEVSLLSVLKEYFEGCGIRTFTYEEPPDLAREIGEKNPHAVLLDIIFPNTSGVEIIQKIKAVRPSLPVIMMTGYADGSMKIESLRRGAYALLNKPFESYEELFHTVNNAVSHYIETQRTLELTGKIQERYEQERLNLLELDFLKGLQHMIGETEDVTFVLRNFSSLLKSFLSFDIFAALIKDQEEINIQIYPNIQANKELVSFISGTLSEKMPGPLTHDNSAVVVTEGEGGAALPDGTDYKFVTVDLSTTGRIYGYAGLYRTSSFSPSEEAIFNRFCSHIALTLEKISLFREIKALSMRDGLTGLYNHAFVIKALEEEIERSKRYNSQLSILLVDIDDFKKINDTYGHLAGDYVLSKVAQILKQGLRTIDTVSRYGGEEFLAILPETDGPRALTVGERLRRDVAREDFTYGGERINLTISGGVADFSLGGDVNKMIKEADDNLYKAKREGKNRIAYD